MEREIYCFIDTVSQNIGEPFTLANINELRREFQKIVENPAVPAYAVRDVIVVHLGTFFADAVNPLIIPLTIPTTVLRGDAYNVDEIRRHISDDAAASSELCTCEDC